MAELSRKEKERLTREQSIVDAAERIFCERGFDEASMDDIAGAAEFTKRTVYQYFTGKEDLYYAVVLKGFRNIDAFICEYMKDSSGGYAKLEALVSGLYRFYCANPDVFLLISRWSFVKRKYGGQTPARSSLEEFNVALFRRIETIFIEGAADGTICTNLSSSESAYSVVYLVMGFMSNFAITGESFIKFQKLDREKFCMSTLGLILKPFDAKGSGGTNK